MENQTTEDIIFEAAYQEFIEKGFEGARMQSIANRAGINKALLHYYYRTKDKLFEAVVPKIIQQLPIGINNILENNNPFEIKIEQIVRFYLNFLKNNPQILQFILRELLTGPDRLAKIFSLVIDKNGNNLVSKLAQMIRKESEAGKIYPISPEHLLTNIISLCVFPFIGRFLIEKIVLNNFEISYEEFIYKREKEVVTFILRALKP
ncbi:MAG: TetR/AcrR family transcriptional regulator [Bacteroidales bacterium]|nr:TetR/AcrR family transcriptional regulator [Bacteroidales bacterium]